MGRGQALFPSLTDTRTPLPFLPQGPRDVSCEDCTLLGSRALTGPLQTWGLGEAHPGCTWVISP